MKIHEIANLRRTPKCGRLWSETQNCWSSFVYLEGM
jgi:hypothetical protein